MDQISLFDGPAEPELPRGTRKRERSSIELKALRGSINTTREAKRGTLAELQPRIDRHAAPVAVSSDRDYVLIADTYCRDVLEGPVVACKWVKAAASRFLRMRALAEAGTSSYLFSESHARDVCAFAERCPHVEGRWQSPTIALEPFQVFILVACYGFRVRETGFRLVTVVFVEVARKSAKSTLVAIAGLYHLAKENEPGAQVVCAATTGQSARIVFGVMNRMVRKSAWLRSLGLEARANSITFEADWSSAKPINAKASTQDGLNPSFISLDESHGQTFALRDVLVSAMGARPQGMIWCPTTAGYDLTSVGYALRTTATKILDGAVQSDHTFVVLYELDEADDWRDEANWIKAAPMIGITPSWRYVREYAADCQQTPGMQGEFETKICNRWLHSANRAILIDQWDKCADARLRPEDFARSRCWIGVDLAERDDIAAVALNFRHEDLIVSFVRGFLPAGVIQDRARAVPEYRMWVNAGELEPTDGDMTDYDRIEAYLTECAGLYDVQAIVIERYGALHLAANLQKKGYPVAVEGKNATICTPPTQELLARIKSRRFRHNGASFLRWQASNVCLERNRNGSMLPVKDGPESPHKIDGIDAILWGWHALLRADTVGDNLQIYFMGG